MIKLHWSTKNEKFIKTNKVGFYKVVGFSLPALKTCPGAGICAGVCYAQQGHFIMPNVKNAYQANLEMSKHPEFVKQAIEDLEVWEKKGYNTVRIHSSGDFYSRTYLRNWKKIMKVMKNMRFYAYTKSLHMKELWKGLPENCHLIQSEGGKYDHLILKDKPNARIFTNEEERDKAGYIDGTSSDIPAIEGNKNIGLIYHGTRHLTDSQKILFSSDSGEKNKMKKS